MDSKDLKQKIWTADDDKEHPDSAMEWWALEAFFKTDKLDKYFSFKADFTEWYTKKPKGEGSLFKITLYDPVKDKTYFQDLRDEFNRLKSSKDIFDVHFQESYIKGAYPNYEMYFNDKKNKIGVKLIYKAESHPHWIAQEITNGWLPLGLGCYRYGFIPKGKITGSMKYDGKKYKIQGFGYFEHIWGEFTYHKLIENIKGMKKSINVYLKFFRNWKKNIKIKIPQKIILSNDNNPFGYDWLWSVLDNGWSIFYGNIMVWLMQGPVAGPLILTKDGINYEEFYKANFKYNKIRYVKDYNFSYPSEIKLIAEKNNKKIHFKCKMTADPREYIKRFDEGKYWKGLLLCEAPGIIEGFYEDEKGKTKLKGICRIEPQRQISILGHNKLIITFLKPPKGVGITFDLYSHFLNKNVFIHLQLTPRLKFKFKTKKLTQKL
ncbi:MAG: hypothetical protein BV457_05740 [Thermoplasmata archaeon M9B1D]|nr:MAG: hypothetical protein BV457_05740 [Thermoplasmata archaeon M9B1D]PNX50476.1 MAG: hypothetical protein BV456_06585 [Thermoplasmata archaeon M8B2D]